MASLVLLLDCCWLLMTTMVLLGCTALCRALTQPSWDQKALSHFPLCFEGGTCCCQLLRASLHAVTETPGQYGTPQK